MQPPASAELATLLATVEEMRATEARLAELKARSTTEAHALANISDRAKRLAAAVYAYWYAPEVDAPALAFAATGQNHASGLLKLIDPVTTGVSCDRCSEPLPIKSRAKMKEALDRVRFNERRFAEGYRIVCKPCHDQIMADRRVADEARDRARAERRAELQRLAYADYLLTPEWQAIRDRYLVGLLHAKQHELDCEVCASTSDRGVYHRSLAALGEHDDLVLLCGTCRDALAAAGRLSGEPGSANRLRDQHAARLVTAHYEERGWDLPKP